MDAAYLAAAHPICIGLGVVCLLGALATLFSQVDGSLGSGGRDFELSPAQFESAFLQSQLLSHLCVITGFVLFLLGAPLRDFAFFAGGTLTVNLGFILPRGLRFWWAYTNGLTPRKAPRSPFDTP